MKITKSAPAPTHDGTQSSSPCRIDFADGIFICNADSGLEVRRIVYRRPRKGEIHINDALQLAEIEADIYPIDLSYAPPVDSDSRLVYVPGYTKRRGLVFLFDDGGKFAYRRMLPVSTNVYIPGDNSNVLPDIRGEVPSKEDFEKAVKELWNMFQTPVKDKLLFLALYPYAYVHFVRRPIIALTAPFRTGKTTLASMLELLWGPTLRVSGSLAGVRGLLGKFHVVMDDFQETTLEDPNINILLAYYDRTLVVRVSPETLKERLYPLRGALILAGAYTLRLVHYTSFAARLFMLYGNLTREMLDVEIALKRLSKDIHYYRWALSRLLLYPHEYYRSLETVMDTPHRRDPVLVTDFINALLIKILDLYQPVKHLSHNDRVDDPYVSVLVHILRKLVKRRADGKFPRNVVVYENNEPVEYGLVDYVNNIRLPTPTDTYDLSLSVTKTPAGKSLTVTKSKRTMSIKAGALEMLLEALDLTMLKTIYVDSKNIGLFVRTDQLDEAIRQIVMVISDHVPWAVNQIPNAVVEQVLNEIKRDLESKYGR